MKMKTFYAIVKVTVHDDGRFDDIRPMTAENVVAGYLEGVLSNGMERCDSADGVIDLSVIDPETDARRCQDLEQMLRGPWPA